MPLRRLLYVPLVSLVPALLNILCQWLDVWYQITPLTDPLEVAPGWGLVLGGTQGVTVPVARPVVGSEKKRGRWFSRFLRFLFTGV